MPYFAASPDPTRSAVGAARPMPHGQATTKTAIANSSAQTARKEKQAYQYTVNGRQQQRMLTPATNGYVKIRLWQNSTETERKPDDPSENRKQSYDRNEISGQDIHYSLNGRSPSLAFTYDFDDLVEPVVNMIRFYLFDL